MKITEGYDLVSKPSYDTKWCEPRDHATHTQRHQFPESQVNQVW
jgi:hypothetical protein